MANEDHRTASIKEELHAIKRPRDALYVERAFLQKLLNGLYQQRRESCQRNHEKWCNYFAKEEENKLERVAAQKVMEDEKKAKLEKVKRSREARKARRRKITFP